MMNQMVPSFVFRRRAWAAIKPAMQVLIVVGLLAMLPSLIGQTVTILTEADPNAYMEKPLENFMALYTEQTMSPAADEADIAAAQQELLTAYQACEQAMMQFWNEKGMILLGVLALDVLVMPLMAAPLLTALRDGLKKKEVTLKGTLSAFRLSPKMLLVNLWMGIRVLLAMLPGIVVVLVAAFLPAGAMMLVMVVGMVVMAVTGIRAALHYGLAPIALAEQPELSINGCVKASWQVMHTRKMEYVFLLFSFAWWYLLRYMIAFLAVSEVMLVICQTLSMMAGLVLTIYIQGTEISFYDTYALAGGASSVKPEEMNPLHGMKGDDLN